MSGQYGYGFGGLPVPEIVPEAKTLAEAITRLIAAERELAEAKTRIPSYTAQWSDADYIANEQAEYNLAANDLHVLLNGPR